MIRAYNEVYLGDAMNTLASFFDIGINSLGMDANILATRFAESNIAQSIEDGSPNYLSGKSATELLSELLGRTVPYVEVSINRTPEYWAGWVLAYSQWYLNKPFGYILQYLPFADLITLYNPYHEAVESKTVQYIQELFPKTSKLQELRKLRKLSQKQLSLLSGVKLRSIQAYEQGDIAICKAEGSTLYALAKTLDCKIEDLL